MRGTFIPSVGENEFEALNDDGVDATWSEPTRLGSASIVMDLIPSEPSLYDDDDDDDDGIFEITSEHPRLGLIGIGTTPGEQIKKMADDHFGRDAFHDEGVGTTPGEQIKKMADGLFE